MSLSKTSMTWQRGAAVAIAGVSTAVVMSLTSGSALAQTAEQAVNFRQGAYQVMEWHLRPLVQMIKGARPFDASLYARNALVIQQMGMVIADGFIPGSDAANLKTRARPEVWSNPAGFKSALERFQGEAAKTVEAGKSGNEKAMRAQLGELIRSCSNCHDDFRAK